MLENVIDTLEDCRFCLMCRHVAPVGNITRQETLTPHGIALTVTSERRGLIDWNEETVAVIFSEVDGGNSRAHCVNDMPFEAAVAAVRAELTARELAPTAVYEAKEKIEKWETPFAEKPPQAMPGTGKMALFVGDEAVHLWPETLPAVLKLLSRAGVEPCLVGYGRSSGHLPLSLGFPDLAKRLAQTTLAEVAAVGASTLLVLSAGDAFTLRQALPEQLGVSVPAEVEIVEVTTFLAQQLAAGAIGINEDGSEKPFAYLDPTHAVRVPERHEVVRQLVTAMFSTPPLELFWRKERAHPVGSTHLQFSRPELADMLTKTRLEDARQSGVSLLLCEDPGTIYQMKRHATDYDIEIKGLYELLAEHVIV